METLISDVFEPTRDAAGDQSRLYITHITSSSHPAVNGLMNNASMTHHAVV